MREGSQKVRKRRGGRANTAEVRTGLKGAAFNAKASKHQETPTMLSSRAAVLSAANF